jgi:hypothetical protein
MPPIFIFPRSPGKKTNASIGGLQTPSSGIEQSVGKSRVLSLWTANLGHTPFELFGVLVVDPFYGFDAPVSTPDQAPFKLAHIIEPSRTLISALEMAF